MSRDPAYAVTGAGSDASLGSFLLELRREALRLADALHLERDSIHGLLKLLQAIVDWRRR
jgi:hypothetical protein